MKEMRTQSEAEKEKEKKERSLPKDGVEGQSLLDGGRVERLDSWRHPFIGCSGKKPEKRPTFVRQELPFERNGVPCDEELSVVEYHLSRTGPRDNGSTSLSDTYVDISSGYRAGIDVRDHDTRL
ncbi:uncharacterized protein MCYG_08200 [Microsporum canis CBS 113480]|uniref:Uncharacterized protein n=1 Tax=Arthroderma otae (strain ATCC MYA-4605 / CBS 113480) TaxID=554155 RepID=C5FZS8_ARTOC|nr:uncharacterized protein MCYG_08200 [Microsporum canis CBS 113480]EEQ35381.1 predicted protein [Microsporum canis CBS 113480]